MSSSGADLARSLVLDTSAYSHLRAGHESVLDRVAAAQMVWMPAVTLGELEAGFELGSRTKENHMALAEFLSGPFVAVRPVTQEVARRYGQIFARLRRIGMPIPINDIWIAATALECGGHLLTFDHDFERIELLDCTVLEI